MVFKFLLICFCLFVGCVCNSIAQVLKINGSVKDKLSNEVLPFVNISILDEALKGTCSNVDGDFELDVTQLPTRLVFSSLSYKTDTVIVSSVLPAVTYLSPSPIHLKEVSVSSDSYPRYLLDKCFTKLIKDDGHRDDCSSFYRQITYNDAIPTEFQEIVFSNIINSFRVVESSIVQGRYSSKKEAFYHFRNFTIFTNYFRLFNLDAEKGFISAIDPSRVVRLTKQFNQDGRRIAEVLILNPSNNNRYSFLIDEDDFALFEFNQQLNDFKIDMPFSHKVKSSIYTQKVCFKQLADGRWRVNRIDVDSNNEVSFALKTRNFHIVSHTFFYDYKSSVTKEAKQREFVKSDREQIDKCAYDACFWQANPIFKRTAEEEEIIEGFTKSNSFGSIYKK